MACYNTATKKDAITKHRNKSKCIKQRFWNSARCLRTKSYLWEIRLWEGDFQVVIAIILHYHTEVSFYYYKSANISNGHASQLVLHWSVDSFVVQLERHVICQYGHSSMKVFVLTVYIPSSAEDFSMTVLALYTSTTAYSSHGLQESAFQLRTAVPLTGSWEDHW